MANIAERPAAVLRAGQPVLVISPHLDDAALGCGELLAACPGSVVVTVMAGSPPPGRALPPWDQLAGFKAGDDVMAARQAEDAAALATLGARPVWLPFLDSQYEDSPSVAAVADRLVQALDEAALPIVLVPLGLFHSDHHLTHAAAMAALRRRPYLRWFAYEDALYRRAPNLTAEQLAALDREGIAATPTRVEAPSATAIKRQAMEAYQSQLRALAAPGKPGYDDALLPERYWRLTMVEAASGG